MSITFDQIRDLLASKFSKEKKRLKSYGTKANSFDMANAVARHVQALMTESRASEWRKFKKKILDKQPSQGDTHKIWKYYEERLKATSAMANAIKNMADKAESERPYKRHKHGRHK